MEEQNQYSLQIDSTIIKMILKSIEEGDINLIKSNISKYNLNLKNDRREIIHKNSRHKFPHF